MKFKINNSMLIDTEEWHKLLKIHTKRIPNCATFYQYKEWRLTAMSAMPPPKSWFCTDCTPSFQRQMIKQKKCDHPYIKFDNFVDGIEGYVDSDDQDVHKITIYSLSAKKEPAHRKALDHYQTPLERKKERNANKSRNRKKKTGPQTQDQNIGGGVEAQPAATPTETWDMLITGLLANSGKIQPGDIK